MVEESTDSLLKAPEENDQESSIISKISAEASASPIDGHNTNAVPRRASIGPDNAGSSSMRNSTERPRPKIRDKVVPNYLRKSTGSCHDLCKYGRKELAEEEAKAKWLILKRNGKVLPNELIPVQILVPDVKRKEKVVNDKPSAQTRRHSLPPPSADTKSYSAKRKTSLEKAKVVGKNRSSADAKNLSGDLHSCDDKSYLRATRTSLEAKTSSSRQSVTHLTKQKPLSTKKLPSPEPPEIIKSVCFPSEKVEVPGKKSSSTTSKIQRSEKQIAVPAKHTYSSLQLSPIKVKPSLSTEKPEARRKGQNSAAGTGKHLAALNVSTKKVLSPKLSHVKIAPIKTRKDGTLKLASPLKEQKRMRRVKTTISGDEKVSEKTLHVIKTETDDNVSETIPGHHAISSLPSLPAEELSDAKSSSLASDQVDMGGIEHPDVEADKFVSDSQESLEIVSIPHPEDNHSKTLRKTRVVVSEVKQFPVKLKFKTGKAVDLKSDNHSPRRLRFRRARVLAAEDSKGSFGRTLRKSVTNDTVAGADNSHEKVVLKHQDVQDKKDTQGLFNNVIEETASKLVESRKSKVKALVGAFETVISLQEIKPSTSAVS